MGKSGQKLGCTWENRTRKTQNKREEKGSEEKRKEGEGKRRGRQKGEGPKLEGVCSSNKFSAGIRQGKVGQGGQVDGKDKVANKKTLVKQCSNNKITVKITRRRTKSKNNS